MTSPPPAQSFYQPPPPPPFIPPDQRERKEFTYQMAKIEVFLFIAFAVYAIIGGLGWIRPRYRTSWWKTLSGSIFFPLAGYLLSFVPGLMSPSSKVSNDIFAFWIAFLVYLAATSNLFTCYTLGDNEDRKKRLFADYIFPWGVVVGAVYKNLAVPQVLGPVVVVFILVVLKMQERQEALAGATFSTYGISRSAEVVDKFLNDPSCSEFHGQRTDDDDGSNLLVDVRDLKVTLQKMSKKWRRKDKEGKKLKKLITTTGRELITMDKVYGRTKTALKVGSSKSDATLIQGLERTCFSLALFWQLLAKAADFKVPESAFVWKTMKHGWEEDGKNINDIFELIGMEIEFLYDFLFTNNYAVYIRGMQKKLTHLLVILLFIWTIVPLFAQFRPQDQELSYLVIDGHLVDAGVTRFVILAIILMEFGNLFIFLTSKWARAVYVCRSIQLHQQNKRTLATGVHLFLLRTWTKFVCRIPLPRRKESTISQYSLVKSHSLPKALWLQPCLGGYIPLPRMGQSTEKAVLVCPILKQAIVSFIDDILQEQAVISPAGGSGGHRKLTNGDKALQRHLPLSQHGLIDTYVRDLQTHAQVILVWHIATSKLEKEEGVVDPKYADFKVATTFSKYCAYLVAYAPALLPDSSFKAERTFDDVIKELDNDKDKSGEEKDYENVNNMSTGEKGTALKQRIEALQDDIPGNDKWKLLASFWLEMLLFLALKCDEYAMEAHAQYLSTGGEFITHLWALATHAGLSKQN